MRVLFFVWRICSAICGLVISRDEQKHPLIKVSLYKEEIDDDGKENFSS